MDNDVILDLLLFLKDTEYLVEEDSIKVWISFNDLEEFVNIFGYDEFCDCSKDVKLLYDCIAFDLQDFLWGYCTEDINYIRNKLIEWSF